MKNIPVDQTVQLKGEFTLIKTDATTGEVTQTVGPFSNLITNIGLDHIGQGGSIVFRAYVGTGTVEPAATDVTMSSFLVASASTSVLTNVVAASSPDWIAKGASSHTFPAGTISNNITEVGSGWAATPLNSLFSRELIRDSAGNPIAITVLPTEILTVVYALSVKIPQEDVTGIFTLGTVDYNYTVRAAQAGGWRVGGAGTAPLVGPRMANCRTGAAVLGGIGGTPSGGSDVPIGSNTTAYAPPYSVGTYTNVTTTNFGLSAFNTPTGIVTTEGPTSAGSDFSSIHARFQMKFDPPLPKTSLITMSFTWRITWARYTPPPSP